MKCEAVAVSALFVQMGSSERADLSMPSIFSKNKKAFLHLSICNFMALHICGRN